MTQVMIPIAIFAGMGVLFGAILAIAAKVFAVKVDSRIPEIQELLPGANCGGCGYSGCAALAEAIVKGEASPNACNSCSEENMKAIGAIMGIEVADKIPMQAQVHCAGTCGVAKINFNYEGVTDCIAAEKMMGGSKACAFGCLGLGTCVAACKFDAIHIINGTAIVDPDKCSGCGACTTVCPKHIISLIPLESKYYVACSSHEKGAVTRKDCDAGCIACRICEKACPAGAITVNDFVATIDQSKCTKCGICVSKCPRKIIRNENEFYKDMVDSISKSAK